MSQSNDSLNRARHTEILRIQSVFSEILETEKVGPEDDFFGLGGDSFDAIRAISRIDKSVKVVALFEHPTAAALADFILSSGAVDQSSNGPRLVAMDDNTAGSAELAVVGVPYGGGDPTVYMGLFRDVPGVQVHGVDFGTLDVTQEGAFEAFLKNISDEIAALGAARTVVYGHCAGSATAVCLAAALQDRCPNLTLVIAAAQPTTDPDAALAAMEATSNTEWGEYLRFLGGFSELSDTETEAMLARGRDHHRIATEAYRRLKENGASRVPALLLLGGADPATEDEQQVIELWKERANIVRTQRIADGGHYFLRTHAKALEDSVMAHANAETFEGAL